MVLSLSADVKSPCSFCQVTHAVGPFKANLNEAPARSFHWRSLLTALLCLLCLLACSGLVHSGRGGAVRACCPGLPAGQVSGQSVRS